jgi:hypothetical protein
MNENIFFQKIPNIKDIDLNFKILGNKLKFAPILRE